MMYGGQFTVHYLCWYKDGVEGRAVVRAHQAIEKDILAQDLIVEVDHQKDIVGGKNITVRFK